MPALSDEDIARLDVTVNDAFGMSCIQGVGHLDRQAQQDFRLDRPAGNAMLQGHAIQKFHGDEGIAGVFADVVNSADIGMIKCGRRLSLALKAVQGLGIAGDFIRKELQSHEPVQPRVFRFVDDAHPATTELFDDAVMGNGSPDHREKMLRPGNPQVNETSAIGLA